MSSRMRSSCSLTNQKSRSFASLNPYWFAFFVNTIMKNL
uniref:Uncharacterized protein n=1 Tax=Parascaris equorum TaxID=6256 RepID=A0A914R174_PAREQ